MSYEYASVSISEVNVLSYTEQRKENKNCASTLSVLQQNKKSFANGDVLILKQLVNPSHMTKVSAQTFSRG